MKFLVAGLFSRKRGPPCTNELESHVGSSLAAGTATHAGQVSSEMPNTETYLGPPRWGLGVGLTSSPSKNSTVSKSQQQRGHSSKIEPNRHRRRMFCKAAGSGEFIIQRKFQRFFHKGSSFCSAGDTVYNVPHNASNARKYTLCNKN